MFDRGCTNEQVEQVMRCGHAKVTAAKKSWRETGRAPRKYGEHCKGCYYWCTQTRTCDYTIIVGHSRQCDSENCIKKITKREGKKLYGMSRQQGLLLTGTKK